MSPTNQGMNELINKELKAQSKYAGFRPARKLFPPGETLNCVMGLSSTQRKLLYPPNTPSEVSSARPVSEDARRSKAAVIPYYYESLPGVEIDLQERPPSQQSDEIYPDDSASNLCAPSSLAPNWPHRPRPF